MKVCDEGLYSLTDNKGKVIVKKQNCYVPNKLLPGKYGDYVDLNIDENGKILNWYPNPSFAELLE